MQQKTPSVIGERLSIQIDMELQQIFTYFLFNRNMPRSDNRSCKLGLRLALVSKQKIELVDIERYSTTHEEYVNVFDITHLHEKDSPGDYPYG